MADIGKVVLPGGSGFLGRTLAKWFSSRGSEVVVLSRGAEAIPGARTVHWDGRTRGSWCDELEGAAAVINLTGRSVNCRYNRRNRREILESRVLSTRVIGEAIARCETPPAIWLNTSTATIYKHTFGPPHDENGETGASIEARDAFSIEVARAWENEFENAQTPKTRKAVLRTAVVFGPEPGSAYDILRRLACLGLGGPVAGGRQYFSWIYADDFCRAIEWIIADESRDGVYNLTAPNPLPNREMNTAMRRAVGMPIGLPAPGPVLELGAWLLRTEPELVIKSRRVVPGRLLKEGFAFEYPNFTDALHVLEKRSVPETGSQRSTG